MNTPTSEPCIIAHRGGVGTDHSAHNTYAAIGVAIAANCAYVEIDIQRTRDGHFVCYHDDFIMTVSGKIMIKDMDLSTFVTLAGTQRDYTTMLSWCKDLIKVHLDIKFDATTGDVLTSPEVACVQEAIDALGAENVIVSTFHDDIVRRVRSWSKEAYPDLLVGLTLGLGRDGRPWWTYTKAVISDLFPDRRLVATGATMIVALGIYARLTLAGAATRNKLPLLVWTIDRQSDVNYWMRHNVMGVITNYPDRARKRK